MCFGASIQHGKDLDVASFKKYGNETMGHGTNK